MSSREDAVGTQQVSCLLFLSQVKYFLLLLCHLVSPFLWLAWLCPGALPAPTTTTTLPQLATFLPQG